MTLADCVVDTVRFHRGMWGPQPIAGCAFKHVVRGHVTSGLRFGVSPESHGTSPSPPVADDPPFTRRTPTSTPALTGPSISARRTSPPSR